MSAGEWADRTDLSSHRLAGRRLAPQSGINDEIESRLDSGSIDMPLWE